MHYYSKDFVVGVSPRELLEEARKSHRPVAEDRPKPGTARQLNEAEIDRVVARYIEVRNVRQVAREYKMSRTTVAKHLSECGISTSKSMSTEQIARAVELYAEGLSSIVIGRQLGFDNHTIIKALRSRNVVIRPPLGNQ